MKRVKIKNEKREKVLREIGTSVDVEEVKKVGGSLKRERKWEMILVKLEKKKQRREVLEKRKRLKDRKERIMED
jgi:predicted MarR family transcription regulator